MKTATISIFAAVLACSVIAGHASLRAQPVSTTVGIEGDDKPWNRTVPIATRESARQVFLEGNRLFKVPLFSRAVEQYTAALSQWKHPAFYFNLALAQLNLGQDVEARDSLEHALQHGEEPLGSERFQEAQKQLHEVERHLGRLRIICRTDGAEVTLDGTTVFRGPGSYETWAKAQAHEVTAKKAEYISEARRVAISPGTLQELDLKLVTLSEAADTGRRWAVWKPWAVVIAGATVTAAAGAVHALSARNFNSYDSQFLALPCANMGGCTDSEIGPNLDSQLTLANREQRIAIAGYIAGGSLVAVGAVLLYMNRPRLLEQGEARSPASRVAVIPSISPDTLGILVSVSH